MSIPGSASPLFFGAGAGEAAAFQIDRSIRINSADSAYLNRTPSSASNRKKWTYSLWAKLQPATIGGYNLLWSCTPNGSSGDQDALYIDNSTDQMILIFNITDPGGSNLDVFKTERRFRDPSAWYHIVLRYDATASSNYVKLYINGVEETDFATDNRNNSNLSDHEAAWNSAGEHRIGKAHSNSDRLNGYLTEINFVDGQVLDPTSFGEFDDNNVWQPIDTSGLTFGTNGFRLKFDDNSSNAALGNDSSGNDNDWTVNNLTATAVDNNWADYVYAGDASYSSSETGTNYFTGAGSNENLFDGSTSTQVGSQNVSHGWVYFRPATAITGVTSLRIYGSYNDTTKINGTDYSESPSWSSTPAWVSVPSPPSSITEIAIRGSGSAAARISAIEVNGAVLVDPAPASDIDSLIDTPTNYTADSGNNGGNYCTLNPLDDRDGATYSNGNLQVDGAGGNAHYVGRASLGVSSGKFYWEATINSSINSTYYPSPGIASMDENVPNQLGDGAGGHAYMANGQKYTSSSLSSYGASFTQGDIIGFALDMDAGTLTAYKNGTSQGTMVTGLTGTWAPSWSHYQSTSLIYNFGQRPFAISSVPTGHKSLCSTNLPDPAIADGSTAMDTSLWTGNGTSQTITGLGFSPDFLWVKGRTEATSNYLTDTVRGITKYVITEQTSQEGTNSNRITAVTSDGFSVGSHTSFNQSNKAYVGWTWDAADSNTTVAKDANGSNLPGAECVYRANTTTGFSVVKVADPQSNEARVHGLSKKPDLIICKSTASSDSWHTYHSSLGYTKYINLNSTGAASSSNQFGSQEPTSTYFYVKSNTGSGANKSGGMIYFIWHAVDQYSAFGSYVGNGSSDGPFIYTGFKVAWLLIKNVDTSGETWTIHDSTRDVGNPAEHRLLPNSDGQESTGTSARFKDLLSNGFKIRGTSGEQNTNGETYIYAAFAEHPMRHARAR